MKKILATVCTVVLLSACQQGAGYDQNQSTYKGAGIGALAGAAIGALKGGKDITDRRQNAMIGAGIGALAGSAVGQYMDRQERAMRSELAGSGVEVQRQGDELMLNMPSSITFATDSSNVKSQFYPTLNDVASVLSRYPKTMVDVIGHTDNTGSDSYNQELSRQRAQTVSSYLRAQGVAGQRLQTFGMGESQPVASNATESGRAQNRRVEIKVVPLTQ